MFRTTGARGRRAMLRGAAAGAGFGAVALHAPAIIGQTKGPYAGTTLNGAAFQTTFFEYLKNYFPEFEEKTGIKVNFNMQAFPVYNQRTDLELSTRGSALDLINVTFIYSGRWIGANWVTNLSEFVNNPNMTPPDWDAADFVAGAQSAMQNAKGDTFGFAWEAGAMILSASRYDLIEKAGLKMPTTFDELVKLCDAIHGKDGVAAFTADRLHHWNWIPYLMGMGGRVFKDPPENLTPLLDTPEAAKSAEWYANLLVKYGPEGVLSYSDDQSMRSQMSGRANIRTQAITWHVPLAKHAESTVKNTVRYALMPPGPQGNFPGSNSHGLGIPAGSRKKEAAWEFIKWAMSKEMLTRIVKQHGYPSVCRRSVINSPEFKEALTLNGQDVASMYLQVLELGGKSGYMKYRTVPVFPQVGDKINKGIERIATKQQDAPAAMKQAQAEAIQDLQRAGYKLDL
ncbi:MAG: extracellular solute-binding protein [Phreatobacter sp.]|uniref:ABC transporter substrate-binding protein n=1 Tax=Phreatobacter sp. TaxID=1966341 RepID=UPI001A57F0A8|nr:extracellular solute-binding protein [Phreatobacter sp.]MBL8571836.1 extracellular solute-binding protein [Phreatobacter sp.]